jgi:membrane protein required for colicin V production
LNDFNLFDIIVLVLITLLGLKGLMRGFIKEVFGLIGIVGGVFIASRLAKTSGDLINSLIPIDNESTRLLIGFVASLIVFWLLAYAIGMIISKMTSLSGLGLFDRLFGFIFGGAKVFLIFAIIIYAISQVDAIKTTLEKKTSDSFMFPILQDTGSFIIKLDTAKLQGKVTKTIDDAIEATKQGVEEISKETLNQEIEKLK